MRAYAIPQGKYCNESQHTACDFLIVKGGTEYREPYPFCTMFDKLLKIDKKSFAYNAKILKIKSCYKATK